MLPLDLLASCAAGDASSANPPPTAGDLPGPAAPRPASASSRSSPPSTSRRCRTSDRHSGACCPRRSSTRPSRTSRASPPPTSSPTDAAVVRRARSAGPRARERIAGALVAVALAFLASGCSRRRGEPLAARGHRRGGATPRDRPLQELRRGHAVRFAFELQDAGHSLSLTGWFDYATGVGYAALGDGGTPNSLLTWEDHTLAAHAPASCGTPASRARRRRHPRRLVDERAARRDRLDAPRGARVHRGTRVDSTGEPAPAAAGRGAVAPRGRGRAAPPSRSSPGPRDLPRAGVGRATPARRRRPASTTGSTRRACSCASTCSLGPSG